MVANERINHPISTAELERRWAAVRAAMAEHRIDALLMQSNNDWMGGYVKYFTDVPATNGYPVTVVFPKDERMTVIAQGPMGVVREFPPQGDPVRRGTARFMGMPSYASCPYTAEYDAQLAEQALEKYWGGTIGLLGRAAMSFALGDYLKRALLRAKFVDASDMVDRIKAVKSPEELDRIRRTAALQDRAMEETFASVRPGMRELEVAAVAEHVGHQYGSEQGLFLAGSGPVGTAMESAGKGNPLAMTYPPDGSVLIIAPSGIPKGVKHPNAAKLFMEYLLSVEASDIWVRHFNESMRPEVKALGGAKSAADVKTIRPTVDEIVKGIPEVIRQWRDTFGV